MLRHGAPSWAVSRVPKYLSSRRFRAQRSLGSPTRAAGAAERCCRPAHVTARAHGAAPAAGCPSTACQSSESARSSAARTCIRGGNEANASPHVARQGATRRGLALPKRPGRGDAARHPRRGSDASTGRAAAGTGPGLAAARGALERAWRTTALVHVKPPGTVVTAATKRIGLNVASAESAHVALRNQCGRRCGHASVTVRRQWKSETFVEHAAPVRGVAYDTREMPQTMDAALQDEHTAAARLLLGLSCW